MLPFNIRFKFERPLLGGGPTPAFLMSHTQLSSPHCYPTALNALVRVREFEGQGDAKQEVKWVSYLLGISPLHSLSLST
jgi:hypothetical protein